MGGIGSLRGEGAWGKGGVAGGLEQGGWVLGRVSQGLGGWVLEGAEGLGSRGRGGWTLRGPDGRSLGRLFGRTDGKFTPLFYRTSSPSGPLPKNGPRPVMVCRILCSAVHTLGSQNVYGRVEGIDDHYWPWAVREFKSDGNTIN